MCARQSRPILALLLAVLPLLGACSYTATCTFENRTSMRLNVYEAYAGNDGVPKRAPSLIRDLDPRATGEGACGVAAGDSEYHIYFEARSYSVPRDRPGVGTGDLVWSEVVSIQELKKRDMRVIIEDTREPHPETTPTASSLLGR